MQHDPSNDDTLALSRLLSLVSYVSGNYRDPATFQALKTALGNAQRPTHYLAIPPALFATVIEGLGAVGLAEGARVIVEKPFGRDLATTLALDAVARSAFAEKSIFRVDHYLGKEAIMNTLYFCFAISFLEPIWNRNHIASVQMTLAEDFGVGQRGSFYESAGCLRDVVENHLFQVVALLAVEPPAYQSFDAVNRTKANVFHVMWKLTADDLVRGQYLGYRSEKDVAADSDVETFCALRLFIDSWRWAGVPWYLRAGKALSCTALEVLIQLQSPPQQLFDDSRPDDGRASYVRFKLQPSAAIALAARVKRAGKGFVGDQRELLLCEEAQNAEITYERLLGDAMSGEGVLFTSQDAVAAVWAVVDPVLDKHHKALPYEPGTWGPQAADALIARDGGWHDLIVEDCI